MSTEQEIRVCVAMGIEPLRTIKVASGKNLPPRYFKEPARPLLIREEPVCPTGTALSEAIKTALRGKVAAFSYAFTSSSAKPHYVEIWKGGAKVAEAFSKDTELGAFLNACEKAFCEKAFCKKADNIHRKGRDGE